MVFLKLVHEQERKIGLFWVLDSDNAVLIVAVSQLKGQQFEMIGQ